MCVCVDVFDAMLCVGVGDNYSVLLGLVWCCLFLSFTSGSRQSILLI